MSKKIILKRVSHTEFGTFGVMMYQSIPFCVTLELPWRDNIANESCIPEGEYIAANIGNGSNFTLLNVPERTGIRIEVANKTSELKGCIAVGEKFEPFGGVIAIQESKKAFEQIKEILAGDPSFILCIQPPLRSEYIKY